MQIEPLKIAAAIFGFDGVDHRIGRAQRGEHFAAHGNGAIQCFAHHLFDAGLTQGDIVGAIKGAGDDRQIGPFALDRLQHRPWVPAAIDGEHQGAGGFDAGGAQDIQAGAVAPEDGVAKAGGDVDEFGIQIDGRDGLAAGPQHLGDHLPHPTAADQHDMAAMVPGAGAFRAVAAAKIILAGDYPAGQPKQQRRERHRTGDDRAEQLRRLMGDQQPAFGFGKQHEAELAALGQQQTHLECARPFGAETARQHGDHGGFHGHHAHHQCQHQCPIGGHDIEIKAHADGDEEKAEHQAAKRLDVGLQSVAIGGFGQHDTGDERAQRHRKPQAGHQQRASHHAKQGGGHEGFAGAQRSDDAEQARQGIAADQHEKDQRARRHQRGLPARHRIGARRSAEGADDGEHRHDGQILEQQHGKAAFATGRRSHLALVEQLHHQCSGGQAERQADDQRCLPRETGEGEQQPREPQPAQHNLRQPKAEDIAPKSPQSRRLQFQTDHEQQQHDTELGELQNLFGIANEAQHRRPDQDTCSEIAQHRPQLEANEQWHKHHRRRQIDDDIAQQGGAMLHQAATCPAWARAASTASSASRIEGCRAR